MSSYVSNWISLRKKITALALVPALIVFLIFGLLIWATSVSTAKLVGKELTNFMAERAARGTIHGWNTSIVTYGYVMDALEANAQTARLMLAKDGGIRQNAGHIESWQAVNDETRQTSTVTVPAISIGAWQSSQAGTARSPIAEIADATGRAVILYERIGTAGDMMRVAGASTEAGAQVTDLGSYIPARMASGDMNPMIKTVVSGAEFQGVSDEMGSPHSVVCEPLREGAGDVFGMACIGMSNNTLRSLNMEIKGNFVGANGSAAVFYVHGKYRGQTILAPTGDAATTENLWLPMILDKAQDTPDERRCGGALLLLCEVGLDDRDRGRFA